MYTIYVLTICLINLAVSQNSPKTNKWSKCCDTQSSVVEQNETLVCQNSTDRRLYFNTSIIQEEKGNSWCLDVFKSSFIIFETEIGELIPRVNITSKAFHKCCPLGYLYNYHNKSCDLTDTESVFKASFMKFGLPDCRIIKDYVLTSWSSTSKMGNNPNQCVDQTISGDFILRVCEEISVCQNTRCLHKCCEDGKSFVNGSNCKDTFDKGLYLEHLLDNIQNLTDNFAIIHGYSADVYLPLTRNFYIDIHGVFHNYLTNKSHPPEEDVYCIEHATKHNVDLGYELFRIIPKHKQKRPMDLKFYFNRYAMIISGVFLMLTVLYYILTKEVRKVFGKIMVSFCLSITLLYGVLVYFTYESELHHQKTKTLCRLMGYCILYLSFACFVWLQVMSLDIYWTFGFPSRMVTDSEKKKRDLNKIICYSIYGWGVPLLMTSLLAVVHHVDVLPESFKIIIGETKCYIEKGDGQYAEVLFRTLPLTIIEVTNCIIFFKTVRYYLRVKSEVERLNDSTINLTKKTTFRAKTERFGLVTKLLVTMGVPYVFEVVSSFYDFKMNSVTRTIEIIWDLINCLQGFFIFLIFVCKRKNLQTCRKSKAVEVMRKISVSSSITRSTSLPSTLKLRKISLDRWRNTKEDKKESMETV